MSSAGNGGPSPQPTATPAGIHIPDVQATPSRPEHSQREASPELGPYYYASERHPKGRRKRTAAKDKHILEAAYNENPKPDKTARLELVQQVSLNEKEVQIWFQNRRQNDRRKSRPLSPQEVAALRTGGMQLLSSDPITSSSQAEDCTSPRADAAPSSVLRKDANTLFATAGRVPDVPSSRFTYRFESPGDAADGAVGQRSLPSHESPLATYSSSTSFSASRVRPSDRWNPDMSFSSCFTPETTNGSVRLRPFFTSSPAHAPVVSGLPTPQSHVRLSLSLEGKAELVSHESSPPRAHPTDPPSSPVPKPRILQRSQSVAAHVTLPPISTLTDDLPPTLRNGRSRDAQAWEQCCDSDTRDELTTQAENESSGSAVAAISLLRSTSGILQPNGVKRNAPPQKWKPLQSKKPRLSRTMSSNAVMQHSGRSSSPVPILKPVNLPAAARSPSGDSDKENWSPAGESAAHNAPPQLSLRKVLGMGPPQTANMRRQGRAVRDQHAPWLLTKGRDRATTSLPRQSSAGSDLEIFEDAESNKARRGSDEVETFMRGGEVSPSKKGDMDCIAGLLSLSQGNWR